MKFQALISRALLGIAICASSTAFAGDLYLLGAGGGSRTDGASSNGTAFKLQLGYMLNPNIAIEGGYVDAGTQKYKFDAVNVEAKTTGGSVAALYIAPLGEQFSVFGKFGYNRFTSSVTAAGYTGSGSGNTSGILYGLGGIIKMTDSVGIRFEYEKVASDTSISTLGVQFKF